jgi:hypothetical protein
MLCPSHQEKKPWWCSGQHTRSGILSSYARLPKILILSLEVWEVAGSNPAHGAQFIFLPVVIARVNIISSLAQANSLNFATHDFDWYAAIDNVTIEVNLFHQHATKGLRSS